MLTKQNIPHGILDDIFKRFNLSVKNYHPLATSGNISYILETVNDDYFLRLCPLGQRWRSKNEILAEIELLDLLNRSKFPVGMPLGDVNGQSIISWGKHHGYIRKYIIAEENLNPSPKDIETFGYTVGRMHSITEDFSTKHKRNHVFSCDSTKRHFVEAKKFILESNFKDARGFTDAYDSAINSLHFSSRLSRGMIHEDLGKRHVLWNHGKIVQVVDFDRSYFGRLIFDLGQACRGWCFSEDWENWSNEKFNALMRGYEKARKLDIYEKADLVDAIKFAILERSLAFCLRYIYVSHDSKDETFARDSLFKQLRIIEENRASMEKIINIK
jgi:Ser/Thr protein kinase RdoA (MazF antagonist)